MKGNKRCISELDEAVLGEWRDDDIGKKSWVGDYMFAKDFCVVVDRLEGLDQHTLVYA